MNDPYLTLSRNQSSPLTRDDFSDNLISDQVFRQHRQAWNIEKTKTKKNNNF